MAFKINTKIYKIDSIYSPQKLQGGKKQFSLVEPPKSKTLKPQKIFPQQNLLDKYQASSIFLNTQNSLKQQLGVQKIPSNSNLNTGKHLFLEYLKNFTNISR
ncbi:MAG: hypothetical protein K2I71_02825 [Helicobacter sp.]|nr:hypothetical protein [Helicobacter sp.]